MLQNEQRSMTVWTIQTTKHWC